VQGNPFATMSPATEEAHSSKVGAAPARAKRLPWTYILLAANLALVWGLPIIPAQDLPQHLSYVRIFADYDDPTLLLRQYYTLPTGFQPYDTLYLLLAAMARHSSVMIALRLTLTVYVALVFASFDLLSGAIHGRPEGTRPMTTGVMASMLVWSSALTMGFFQYFLCMPLVVLVVAALVRGAQRDARRWTVLAAAGASAAVGSIHLVAAGALAVFAVLHTVLGLRRPDPWRRAMMSGTVVGTLAATLGLWHLLGGEILGAKRHIEVADAWRAAMGFEFVNSVLDTTWYDPTVTFNYICWGTLGPYRLPGLAVAAASVVVCVTEISKAAMPPALGPEARGYARTAWAFALFTCLIPWGIQIPSEITWLNFRLIALAFALLLPLIPPRWFEVERARTALIGLALVYLGNFTVHAVGFNFEAASVTRLLARVPNRDVLLSLVFRSRSAYFAKGMRVTHFLPMYFTVLEGGICTQFWARYTEHLPIDYRHGKRPAQADDWNPSHFDETKHLRDAGWVLLQRATSDDATATQHDAARAEQRLGQRATLVECDGLWCLYRVRARESG
jgi:hypothetical protein